MRTGIHYAFSVLLLVVQAAYADVATPPRTGYYTVMMSPVAALGEASAANLAEILPPEEEISWQLYVPENYSRDKPAGIVVYISPGTGGGPPRNWTPALDERNLIWIGANGLGNRVNVAERMLTAMIAPMVLDKKEFRVDINRCYIAGFSGGGRTATLVATARPEEFRGGLYMGGALSWEEQNPPDLEKMRRNRYVFIAGAKDPALQETRQVFDQFREAGIEYSRLVKIRNHRHELPPPKEFSKAIDYLDGVATTDE